MEVTFTVSKWDEKQLMILEKIFLLILLMLNMISMGNYKEKLLLNTYYIIWTQI